MNKDYFLSRRSCRNFKKGNLDYQLIKEIISEATKAPTCGNMQLYSIVVTQDEKNLKKLSALHYNQPAASTAPLILTICADFNRFTKWCEDNSAEAGFNNFHSFITAMTDAVILGQQIVTIAEMKGLATCYLGTVIYNAKEISNLLSLPELVVPVVSISIGKAEEVGEETFRLPIEAILHEESYHNYTDKEIADLYKVHDEDIRNAKFITENNKKNIAQVFAEIRYPKKTNEAISESFINLLTQKDFIQE